MAESIRSEQLQHISIPHPHDVLCGRGMGLMKHKGNVQFRQWVNEFKTSYILSDSNVEKAKFVEIIVGRVQDQRPPGRFLCRKQGWSPHRGKGSINDGVWELAGTLHAEEKTKQALREGAHI
eukprot:12467101-Ditylum_brightwellii.AAC.1